ncbi:MAG: NAD(P)/FAD-dependent oxidoreductase [Eubacteriales bacterium]
MNDMIHDVIVVGGGAAGMMAAITAANLGKSVVLLEHNRTLGKKLLITGKGRCNVTNDCTAEVVLQNVPRNSRFLYSAMAGYPPAKIMEFFESRGCPLQTERGNRVFPQSEKSADINRVLTRAMEEAGVDVRYGDVLELIARDGTVVGVITDVEEVRGSATILATGGCSYPQTGSTGDGYRLAKSVGHTVVPPVGSLVPMVEDGDMCKRMMGLSLKNVEVKMINQKKKVVYADFGEMLFTHFGLSGPVILSASAHMKPKDTYTISIDLKPALDEKKLNERLLRDFELYQNKDFENALGDLLPRKMIPVVVHRSGIPGDTKVHSITKEQRRSLLELLKHFTVPIAGLRPVDEAIITAGGIKVSEVNPKTMESKLASGLFFAGEILDVDAYTGGFNLQIAWATAVAAAKGIVE